MMRVFGRTTLVMLAVSMPLTVESQTHSNTVEESETGGHYIQMGSTTTRYDSPVVPLGPEVVRSVRHDSWPTGIGFTLGWGFQTMIFDQSGFVWAVPYQATHLLRIDITSSQPMEGYNSWPGGFTYSSNTFIGAGFDGQFIYALPNTVNGVLRVDTVVPNVGTMHCYCSWPGVTFSVGRYFSGIVFKVAGTGYAWLAPGGATHVVRLDPHTGDITLYNGWPGGYSFSSYRQNGVIYDQSSDLSGTSTGQGALWMPPQRANMFLQIDPVTGTMVGHNSWPAGFTLGLNPLGSAAFDAVGHRIFCSPRDANAILLVDSRTGTMGAIFTADFPTGACSSGNYLYDTIFHDGRDLFLTPRNCPFMVKVDLATNLLSKYGEWPAGFTPPASHGFTGLAYDGVSLWMPPYAASAVIQFQTGTSSHTESSTKEASATYQFQLQNGQSSSGASAVAPKPLDGDQMISTTYSTWPSPGTVGTNAFGDVLNIGAHMWVMPFYADKIFRIHKATGVVAEYSNWASAGVTCCPSISFTAYSFDPRTNLIWMVPYVATHVLSFDTVTGLMAAFTGWPAGIATNCFIGSFISQSGFLWMAPYGTNNMLVRVDVNAGGVQGTMTGLSNWPTGFTATGAYFGGILYDGSKYGWTVPHQCTIVVRVESTTGTMTGYGNYPAGFVSGIYPLKGGGYDGQHIWMVPRTSNMALSLDQGTGVMVGYNSWPNGFAISGATAFWVSTFDGQYLWMAPYDANMLIRLDTQSGAMIGFKWSGTIIRGTMLDPETKSLYVIEYGTTTLVRLQFFTSTPTSTKTQEATNTYHPFVLQSGTSSSGPSPWASVPLDGTHVKHVQTVLAPGGGYATGATAFQGPINTVDHIWLIPYGGTQVISYHKTTGVVTGYNTWATAGFTKTTSNFFVGAAYDAVTGIIWMVPLTGYVISFDTSNGNMAKFNGYPAGYNNNNFRGGIIHKAFLFLGPCRANMVIRVSTADGSMPTGFDSWPTGFNGGAAGLDWGSIVYDGGLHGWLLPQASNMVVRVNLETGTMKSYQSWPGGFTPGANQAFYTGAFDGQRVWMGPRSANMLVAVDQHTGVMSGFNTWPVGWTGLPTYITHDGQYLWMSNDGSMFARLDFATGVIRGFEAPFSCWNMVVDPPTNSIFSVAISGVTETLTQTIVWTPTSTETVTITPAVTPSPTQTATITSAPTSTAMATKTLSHPETLTFDETATRSGATTSPSRSPSFQITGALRVVVVSTTATPSGPRGLSETAISVRILVPQGFNSTTMASHSLRITASTSAVPFTSCGSGSMILTDKTNIGFNFTIPLSFASMASAVASSNTTSSGLFSSAQNLTAILPLWLLRDSGVLLNVSVLDELAVPTAPPLEDVPIQLRTQTAPLLAAQQEAAIASISPPLHQLRQGGDGTPATHLTVAGTGLTLLPDELLVGPFVVAVSVTDNSTATVGPIPGQPQNVWQIQQELASGFNVPALVFLLRSGGGGANCPLQGLRSVLYLLAPATLVDISDFFLRPNGTVTLLPKMLPVVTFPNSAYAARSGVATIEAGGETLNPVEVGVVFQDLAGMPIAAPFPYVSSSSALDSQVSSTLASTAALATSAVMAGSWTRSNATHFSFAMSQPATALETAVNLTLLHSWSSRVVASTYSIPIIRPRLNVQCAATSVPSSTRRQQQQSPGRTLRGLQVQVSSPDGSPKNVSITLFVESRLGAAVKLSPLSTDSATVAACSASYPGQTCLIPQVRSAGVDSQLEFVVSAPRYYQLDMTVVWEANAAAAFASNSGRFSLVGEGGGSNTQSGSFGSNQGQATGSPPSTPGSSGTQTSAVFGFSSQAPCIDALLLSWLVFIVVLSVLALLSIYMAKSIFKSTQVSKGTREDGVLQQGVEVEAQVIALEKVRSAWLAPPMLRSLLLHHPWLSVFVPCHDQCAVGHGLTTFNHLLTLLWVCAALVLMMAGSGAIALPGTSKIVIALLTVLIAQPLRPLLSMYYYAYSVVVVPQESVSEGSTTAALNSGRATEGSQVVEGLSPKQKSNVNLVGLNDVELDSNNGNDEDLREEEQEETFEDDVVMLDENKKKKKKKSISDVTPKEEQEREQTEEGEDGQEELLEIQDVVKKKEGSSSVCDVHTHDESNNNTNEHKEENQRESPGGTTHHGRSLIGLQKLEDTAGKREEKEKYPVQAQEELVLKKGKQQLLPVANTGHIFVSYATRYVATPLRNRGHLVNAVYCAIATILAFSLGFRLRPDNNSTICPAYLTEILPIVILVDLLAVQPLVVLLVYGYRWTVANPQNQEEKDEKFGDVRGDRLDGLWSQLHPRDCIEIEEYLEEAEEDVEVIRLGTL